MQSEINPTIRVLDEHKLANIIMLSNTPVYMFDNFLRTESVIDFSQKNTDQELIKTFYEYCVPEMDITNYVVYSCIVALSLKNSSYVVSFFNDLKNNTTVRWAKELADIYISRVKSISVDMFDIEYQSIHNDIKSSFYTSELTEINL